MIIICTIDNSYIRHCAVMLRSLRDHNPESSLSVYVVHQSLDRTERARLVEYLGGFLPSVSFLQVEPEILRDFPVFGHISIATYFRLLFPAILPAGIDRAIFLDCDLIVNDSLSDLWGTSLADHPIAAVTDRNLDMQRKRLGMKHDSPYFNAGLMVMQLSLWRREHVLENGLSFARSHPEKLQNWDQDVLNHLFEGRCILLPQRWNACSHLWGLDQEWIKAQGGLSEEERAARDHPAVIHFAGPGFNKPWNHNCPHPWRHRYREILSQTPWAHMPLDDTPPPRLTRLRDRAIFRTKSMARNLGSRLPIRSWLRGSS